MELQFQSHVSGKNLRILGATSFSDKGAADIADSNCCSEANSSSSGPIPFRFPIEITSTTSKSKRSICELKKNSRKEFYYFYLRLDGTTAFVMINKLAV